MNESPFDPVAELCSAHPGMSPEAALDLRVDGLRDELAALGVNLGPPLDLETGHAAAGMTPRGLLSLAERHRVSRQAVAAVKPLGRAGIEPLAVLVTVAV